MAKSASATDVNLTSLPEILEHEILKYPGFIGKVGESDQHGSLAWMITESIKNYRAALDNLTENIKRDYILEGYLSILKATGADSAYLKRFKGYFIYKSIDGTFILPTTFLLMANKAKEMDYESKIIEYVRKIRGTQEPSKEIIQYAGLIWAVSEALNRRDRPLEKILYSSCP